MFKHSGGLQAGTTIFSQYFRDECIGKCAGKFLSTWHMLAASGKREPQLRNCHPQIGLSVNLWGILLMNDGYGRAQPTMAMPLLGRWFWFI